MPNCYLCDRGAREGVSTQRHNSMPLCALCLSLHVTTSAPVVAKKEEPKPVVVKVEADSVHTTHGPLYLKVWRNGGCIFCGGGARPTGNKMSHGECFRAASEAWVKEALQYVAKEKSS